MTILGGAMSEFNAKSRKPWCIVVADDHGPEFIPSVAGEGRSPPVPYCRFGEPATLLQKTLHRARQIAPTRQITVTVRDEDREHWEPALWFVHPERRIISDARIAASLSTMAAVFTIAADSVSDVVTILPSRCYVANEWILSAALEQLHAALPTISEGVGTLGMIDIDDGVDEDYLVPCSTRVGAGSAVQAVARQPAGWVARHLRQHGAMVASGILTGYAGVFAAHIFKYRRDLAKALSKVAGVSKGRENRLCADAYRGLPKSALYPLRWCPPTFPQRAFRVYRCGWRGLRTARAVARISASCPAPDASVPQLPAAPEFQPSAHSCSFLPVDCRILT
jgi:mannose-1-phosphate guanylyltransferase